MFYIFPAFSIACAHAVWNDDDMDSTKTEIYHRKKSQRHTTHSNQMLWCTNEWFAWCMPMQSKHKALPHIIADIAGFGNSICIIVYTFSESFSVHPMIVNPTNSNHRLFLCYSSPGPIPPLRLSMFSSQALYASFFHSILLHFPVRLLYIMKTISQLI